MKQGTNAAIMRKRNEKIILSLINAEPVSRAQIAKITGLTRAAVTIIIDDLIEKGYILEAPTRQATVGRQPVLPSFRGSELYAIGFNIQQNHFYVGISDFSGRIITEEKFPTPAPELSFDRIRGIVEEQIDRAGIDREKIYSIGAATLGPVDAQKQNILNLPNFKDWHNVPVAQRLQECLGYGVHLENVPNAGALV